MSQTPQDEWVDINGLSFHYRDWGGTGQPIVLLHGLASTCHIWDLVAPILAKDFSVIAMDQRGHGQSAKPEFGYEFATVGSDLLGIIKAKGLNSPVLIGHSWGGDVALELAVSHPGVAKGLGFVDGGMINASANHSTLDAARKQMAPPNFAELSVEKFMTFVGLGQLAGSLTPEVQEIVLANFEVEDGRLIRARLSRDNHIRIIEALWEHHPSDLYSSVKCPVLIMPARRSSDSDREERLARRSASVALAEKHLPNSKTVWLEDSIHDVPIQRPELVANVIKEGFTQGFFA